MKFIVVLSLETEDGAIAAVEQIKTVLPECVYQILPNDHDPDVMETEEDLAEMRARREEVACEDPAEEMRSVRITELYLQLLRDGDMSQADWEWYYAQHHLDLPLEEFKVAERKLAAR